MHSNPISPSCLAWGVVLLAGLGLLGGCRSERLAPSEPPTSSADNEAPESWVRPESSPIYWTVWADARDYVGEKRWAALDTSWMAARARTDLATVTTKDDYDDVYLLSGIWRLGLLRDEVVAVLAAREPLPGWPLMTPDRRSSPEWRLRVERWFRAQPDGEAVAKLRAKLDAAWSEAVAAKDLKLAGRVAEALDIWIGREAADPLAPAAQALARDALVRLEARGKADSRDARIGAGLLYLLERFGVPAGVDLTQVASAARHYYEEMLDESIPLPHPYDLHLATLRIERLRNRAR